MPSRLVLIVSFLLACVPARADGPAASPPAPNGNEAMVLGAPSQHEDRGGPLERPLIPAGSLSRTLIALAFVVGLILVLAAVTRRIGRGRGGLSAAMGAARAPAGVLEILGRFPAGAGRAFVLLKVDRRVLLLNQTIGGKLGVGGGYSTIAEFTDPDEVASLIAKTRDMDGDSMAQRFGALLGRFGERHDEADRAVARRIPAPLARPGPPPARTEDSSSEAMTEDPRSAIASLRRRLSQIGGA